MLELDLPRTYQTIYVCAAFGIGSTRQLDALALQRFYQHLIPGGVLLLDHQMPYIEVGWWKYWLKENQQQMGPDFWSEVKR